MKIKTQIIVLLVVIYFQSHSQNQLFSVGFGLGKAFQENSGFSYGGQLSLSSTLDSANVLRVQ